MNNRLADSTKGGAEPLRTTATLRSDSPLSRAATPSIQDDLARQRLIFHRIYQRALGLGTAALEAEAKEEPPISGAALMVEV